MVRPLPAKLVAIGLVAGVLSALFGVGGGIAIVPLLLLVCAFAPREAAATSLGAVAITALGGVVLYALRGDVRVGHAALVGLPAMAGALAGTGLQQRISGTTLTFAFAAMLSGIAVWLIIG